MNVKLLGQGLESTSEVSVGYQLLNFLKNKEFHSFTAFSAFTSQAGIRGLSKHIDKAKKHLKKITIVTGVDQKGTSKEALEELLSLKVRSYIFYQPSITIFHPKIYLFEGRTTSELIIGSSNLTAQGLFTNVETSLLISIDNALEEDRRIILQLKDYYKGIFDATDPNLKKLSRNIIAELVKAKVVPTEAYRRELQDKMEKSQGSVTHHIVLKIFPERAIAKIPKEFKAFKKSSIPKPVPEVASVGGYTAKVRLVWVSGEMTERDLNIPGGSNTNPTGSMLFKKGKTPGIDQRHYFRDTVFANLKWIRDNKPRTSHIERSEANFIIVINNQNEGRFRLALSHNTRTNTRSYIQKNSMTSISWGSAKSKIANKDLIGKNVNLYKTSKKEEFILEIK